jgi:hypothetical protein
MSELIKDYYRKLQHAIAEADRNLARIRNGMTEKERDDLVEGHGRQYRLETTREHSHLEGVSWGLRLARRALTEANHWLVEKPEEPGRVNIQTVGDFLSPKQYGELLEHANREGYKEWPRDDPRDVILYCCERLSQMVIDEMSMANKKKMDFMAGVIAYLSVKGRDSSEPAPISHYREPFGGANQIEDFLRDIGHLPKEEAERAQTK